MVLLSVPYSWHWLRRLRRFGVLDRPNRGSPTRLPILVQDQPKPEEHIVACCHAPLLATWSAGDCVAAPKAVTVACVASTPPCGKRVQLLSRNWTIEGSCPLVRRGGATSLRKLGAQQARRSSCLARLFIPNTGAGCSSHPQERKRPSIIIEFLPADECEPATGVEGAGRSVLLVYLDS